MDPQQWEKVKDLFELGEPMTPAERDDLLAKEPDEVVRKEAARLLKINPVKAFIDQPVMSPEYLDRFTGHAALLAEGEMLGTRYKIEKRIASGGMGDVYSAYDKDLRERVAIKTIRQDIISNPAIVSRFRREISLARRVAHPNVCKVYDLSQEARSSDGRTVDFLTMELVEGETLSQWLKREAPVGFEVARPLLEQICAGLAAAHDAGVVHRDLKGSNVLIAKKADGTLRAAVTDFGLARSVSPATGASHESSTGLAGGTPAYMAPEQMEGRTVGPKADLYALGIVMYEMATGTAPHTGDSPLQIAVRRVTEKPQAPRTVNPDIDPSWEEAILRCLEYKAEDRPADARAVAELFGKDRPLFTVPRWRMPRWLVPALAGAAVVALGVWWWSNRPPEHSEEAMRWYRKGTDALMDGAYSTARASFEQAVKLEPGFGVARARLADTLFELDLREEAAREISKAQAESPDERLFIEGIQLALKNQIPEALEKIERRLERNRSAETLLDKARVLERSGRVDPAIAAYKAVLERDPSLPGALLRLGIQLTSLGRKTEAKAALAKSELAYLGNPEGKASVFIERAKVVAKMEEAAELASNARTLAKGASSATLEVRAVFAESYYRARAGETKRAWQLATEAQQLAASLGETAAAAAGLKELAYVPYSNGDYKAAAERYKTALDVAERGGSTRTVADIKRSLGDSLVRADRYDLGVRYIEEARQFHEANGFKLDALTDRLYLADADAYSKRYDSSLQKQRELLAEAEQLEGAERFVQRLRLSLILNLYGRGEYPEALSLGQAALPLYRQSGEKPKEHWVRIYVAGSLRHLGRYSEARDVLAPVLVDRDGVLYHDAVDEEVYLLRDEGSLETAIRREAGRSKTGLTPAPGSDSAGRLCTLYSLAGKLDLAEKWCLPNRLAVSDSSAGYLFPSLFRIQMGRKRWAEADQTATKFLDWVSSRRDPEKRLLAQLMAVVGTTRGGTAPPHSDRLAAWRKEFGELKARWGAANVRGMLSQSSFRTLVKLRPELQYDQ